MVDQEPVKKPRIIYMRDMPEVARLLADHFFGGQNLNGMFEHAEEMAREAGAVGKRVPRYGPSLNLSKQGEVRNG
jgi:hypothetical protein